MSQLRSDILRQRKRAEIEKSENLFKRNYLATPIKPHDQITDNENSENEEDIMTISDDEKNNDNTSVKENFELNILEDDESDTIYSTERWVHIIQNWMNMAREEEEIDLNNNNERNIDPLTFIAVDRTIHPADDSLAKWELRTIFNNKLESPAFVNALINLDSN